ncbi:hypothetical protein AHiyo1_02070 [Arthrobacter sp. Hiyo1]|uniref:Ltp family lipoprotein n=1 Tax=Arthrobacter sp. Hiyo1 TaxID=1588020 RepID=UPI0007232C41|nr:Ltp family lipoprotein [Arthrobacter sp. Hiyo1]GAP57366.1 hypothetical protein AHiyo1_02070 [Arthrobacter sp. Hiyo1]
MTRENTQPDVKSNAKAQAAADKAYRKASRPWFKKKRFILLMILVVIIIIIAIAANSGKKDAAATSAPATSAASTQAASPAAQSGTAAQLQALAAAKGYLDSGIGFSQASLTKQLTSSAGNGFAQADAQWLLITPGQTGTRRPSKRRKAI